MVTDPVRALAAVGVNVAVIVQLAPAAPSRRTSWLPEVAWMP
jgi:hypothetical protein